MNLMGNETENHGVLLTRYLEKEWDALYTTRGAWCREHGLPDTTVYRWSQGVEPDIGTMMKIADALGRKLVEVLYHAGYVDESDLRLRTVAPPRERIDVIGAIRTDPELTDQQRQALLAVHTALVAPSPNGRKQTIRVSRRG